MEVASAIYYLVEVILKETFKPAEISVFFPFNKTKLLMFHERTLMPRNETMSLGFKPIFPPSILIEFQFWSLWYKLVDSVMCFSTFTILVTFAKFHQTGIKNASEPHIHELNHLFLWVTHAQLSPCTFTDKVQSLTTNWIELGKVAKISAFTKETDRIDDIWNTGTKTEIHKNTRTAPHSV